MSLPKVHSYLNFPLAISLKTNVLAAKLKLSYSVMEQSNRMSKLFLVNSNFKFLLIKYNDENN